jgi:hypothetical protein
MKKQFFSVISKLTLGILFAIAVIAVQAQSPVQTAGEKGNPLEVKYLGTQEDMIVFNVSYQNPSGGKFSIIVKDQDGSQLYQVVYNEKSFDKQFRLPRAEKNRVTFVIRNYKDADMARTFDINVNSRMVEDVAVKKLD